MRRLLLTRCQRQRKQKSADHVGSNGNSHAVSVGVQTGDVNADGGTAACRLTGKSSGGWQRARGPLVDSTPAKQPNRQSSAIQCFSCSQAIAGDLAHPSGLFELDAGAEPRRQGR
ncbi:hypothetical protein TI01_0688 [Lysobacter sp. A03]|nr:hypothetical protein TI01_0688 [Lysobacter sp. A03]